jgi:nitrate/TMAO reductase-like tetraheme cytochrome c subunit
MKTRFLRILLLAFFTCVIVGCGRQVAAPVVGSELVGTVVDADGPVAASSVRIQATAHHTTTDADGSFHLPHISEPANITAWKEGAFIGLSRSDAAPVRILLKPLPAQDNPAYTWIDPGPSEKDDQNCARCHAEIVKEWSASAHSRSASGRHFRNLYEGTSWNGKAGVGWSLLDEHPTGAAVCTSCHAPAVADDDPAQFDLRELHGTAAQGVHCDYCHKIAGVGDGKIGLTHGRFNLSLLRPTEGQVFFGPLDDATRGNDAFSPLYHDSKYCASCHEGVVFGVPVYSTYSEWKESPSYKEGRQCQDCHMAPTGRMTNIAPGDGGVERDPRTLGSHLLFDGDQETMLRRCLQASVESRRKADGLHVIVRLWAEGAGHRVPTGFVDKHLILLVEAQDAAGKPVALRSGPRLPSAAGKELEGQPGKLYAKLLRDFDGRSPVPFWRADPEPVDTRLTPGRTDESDFDFAPATTKIRVRVLYRRFWKEVGRSKGWPDGDITILQREIE